MIASKIVSQKKSFTYEAFYFYFWFFSITAIFVDLSERMAATRLFDNHGRPINYLRLAVTDRCNLRCFYCMPETGVKFEAREKLLTFEEIERFVRIAVSLPARAQRVTVFGSTRNRAATSPGVSSRSLLPSTSHLLASVGVCP